MREKKSLNYLIVMGLALSPSVRSMRTSNGVGVKIGRMHSEEEEEGEEGEEKEGDRR